MPTLMMVEVYKLEELDTDERQRAFHDYFVHLEEDKPMDYMQFRDISEGMGWYYLHTGHFMGDMLSEGNGQSFN